MSLTLSEISSADEFTTWDAFVAQHPEGSFAQLSGWANLKQQFDWQPHILVVRDADTVVAGALMMDRVSLLGKKVSYVPYGPLIEDSNHAALAMLLDGMVQESRGSVILRLEPHEVRGQAVTDELLKFGFVRAERFLQPEATLMLDLRQSEDELQSGMRQTTRRYIRQAERAGLSIVEDISGERLDDFYQSLSQVNQRRQFGVHTLEYYQSVWKSLGGSSEREVGTQGDVQPYLFLVQQENRVLGAYFVVRMANKSWELYGGVNEEGMKLKANYLLKWQAMLAMKRDGVVHYDQWGVAPLQEGTDDGSEMGNYDKNHHLAGVTYFKEGFGGKRVAYVGSYDKVNQPVFYAIARALKKL